MSAFVTLIQSLGVAYCAGISLPATVAILGVASREGWIAPLPGDLAVVGNPWILGLAVGLACVEFMLTVVPGIASVWETVQTFIRPPAAAILAVATVVHLDPIWMVAAALCGGTLALTTHGTKLGIRYAIDTSPEPVSNVAANVAEFGTVSAIGVAVWHHPYITILAAAVLLVLMMLLVRRVIRSLRQLFT